MVALLKKLIFKGYVILLMMFTVWYGHFMYPIIFGFEDKGAAEDSLREMGGGGTNDEKLFVNLIADRVTTKTTDLGYKKIEQPYIEGRFHHIGFEIQEDNMSPCISCHGNTPHSESKEIRSFLNMHTFYLACETCHAKAEPTQPWHFRWYDKDTGEIVQNPTEMSNIENSMRFEAESKFYPVYGDYGAKIAPVKMVNNQFELLSGAKEKAFIKRYNNERDSLKPAQTAQMDNIIHKLVTKDAVLCESCHQSNQPYLEFEELGYPKLRSRELSNLPVIEMLKKYNQFYIPNLFSKE